MFDNYVHITQPDAKTVPNCDVSGIWARDVDDERVTKIRS